MLILVAFVGGVLTILSPCILPVLPFVFTRAGQPFVRSILPMLAGMAITFAAVATLAAVGGGWAVEANRWGRWIALALVLVFGLALLSPALADRMTRPFVRLGNRLTASAGNRGGVGSSLVLGVATGLLWAPCAGPILGLILAGAALQGASAETSVLLLAYAAGSAVSLAAALLLGGKVFAALKRSLGAEEWLRRGLGVAVVIAAVAIAFGLDTGFLARLSTASTERFEESVFARLLPASRDAAVARGGSVLEPGAGGAMMAGSNAMMAANPAMTGNAAAAANGLPIEGEMPALTGATEWLNSAPLTAEALRGNVVLVDFWTYSCINCIRTLPYVKAWHEKYRDQGLVVVGIHSPEFAFEKRVANVRREVRQLGIEYPVAIDNDYTLWRAFANRYWPAHYFIDAAGKVRHRHFGEGGYDESERVIQQLLAEAGRRPSDSGLVDPQAQGAALASDEFLVLSPETYIGHARAEHFQSPGGLKPGQAVDYAAPARLGLNEWALEGNWTVGEEDAALNVAPGSLTFRFHARDLHLVLGLVADDKPVRFRITLDGAAPGDDAGVDVDAAGNGTVTDDRLYQLIRQDAGATGDRLFKIEFMDPGVTAFAFTFG